jgi:starch-binding outer membrane protein, SusD/RagB family
MRNRILLAALCAGTLAGCSDKPLQLTNPNVATIVGASADPAALQLQATGLLVNFRDSRIGYMSQVGRLGRESYIFTPQEGRNTTNYIIGISVGSKTELDPAGFTPAIWNYPALRNIYNFKISVNSSTVLSAQQKSAALGMAKAFEAYHLLNIISETDTLGLVVQINADPTVLSPFVSRDSAYKYILASLDSSLVALGAGGSAFPFTLHSGFKNFDTPATFRKFVSAIEARAAAYYATGGGGAASGGCGATCWTKAQTALAASFLNMNAASATDMNVGVYNIYSTASGDNTSSLDPFSASTLFAHMSYLTDAQPGDLRLTNKINTGLVGRQGPVTGAGPTSAISTIGFNIWKTNTDPVAAIRNEELILLNAEVKLALGDLAGAIAAINVTRTVSGGLPPSTLTPASGASAILDQILYEKRYSLMFEGFRWVDMRRYGRLNQLPLDVPSGPNKNFVAIVAPIPQGECLVRAKASGAFLGPNGQNDCAP